MVASSHRFESTRKSQRQHHRLEKVDSSFQRLRASSRLSANPMVGSLPEDMVCSGSCIIFAQAACLRLRVFLFKELPRRITCRP